MVGVGVVILVSHSRNYAELLAVDFSELAGKSFGGSCKHRIVMSILVAISIYFVAHEGHYSQPEFLSFFRFAVMFPYEGNQSLGKADKADSESALVDYLFNSVVRPMLSE